MTRKQYIRFRSKNQVPLYQYFTEHGGTLPEKVVLKIIDQWLFRVGRTSRDLINQILDYYPPSSKLLLHPNSMQLAPHGICISLALDKTSSSP